MLTLKQIKLPDKDRFWNIFQKYLYELTCYYDMDMDASGNYPYPYFDRYFAEPERTAMFIYDGEVLVGFAMLNDHSCLGNRIDHAIAEFTIFPQYRERRLGIKAVQEIFARYRGRWEIKYSTKNKAAQALWTKAAEEYAPTLSPFGDTETVLSFVVA